MRWHGRVIYSTWRPRSTPSRMRSAPEGALTRIPDLSTTAGDVLQHLPTARSLSHLAYLAPARARLRRGSLQATEIREAARPHGGERLSRSEYAERVEQLRRRYTVLSLLPRQFPHLADSASLEGQLLQ